MEIDSIRPCVCVYMRVCALMEAHTCTQCMGDGTCCKQTCVQCHSSDQVLPCTAMSAHYRTLSAHCIILYTIINEHTLPNILYCIMYMWIYMQFNKVVSTNTVTLSCVLYKINHNTNNTNTSTNDVHTHHIIQNPHTPTVLQPCTHTLSHWRPLMSHVRSLPGGSSLG